MQPNSTVAKQLSQFADRLPTAQLGLLVRSRRWLVGASAICLLIVGLIVLFQPAADEELALDEFDFPKLEEATFGDRPSAAGSGQSIDAELANIAHSSAPIGGDSLPRAVNLIPDVVPQPDQGVRPLGSNSATFPGRPTVWLTGTIEE